MYRLVDEFDNDVAYDFKGLLFFVVDDLVYSGLRYTFDTLGTSGFPSRDISLPGATTTLESNGQARGNRIGPYRENVSGVRQQKLNYIVFRGGKVWDNVVDTDCRNIKTIVPSPGTVSIPNMRFSRNRFYAGCYGITFELGSSESTDNVFGANCRAITLGSQSGSNVFCPSCYNITLGYNAQKNVFGSGCHDITAGDSFYQAQLGCACNNFTFGASVSKLTVGAACANITAGDYLSASSFGSFVRDVTFGSYIDNVHIGDGCMYITLGSSSAAKSYCRSIVIGNGCKYLYLDPTGTTASSSYYQNVTVLPGASGTSSSNRKTISDPNVGQAFHTTYKPANSQEVSV